MYARPSINMIDQCGLWCSATVAGFAVVCHCVDSRMVAASCITHVSCVVAALLERLAAAVLVTFLFFRPYVTLYKALSVLPSHTRSPTAKC